MSRWIDADALIEGIANKFYNEASTAEAFDMVNKVCDYITGVPSIDIVRCKECKKAFNAENEWICNHLSGMVGLNVVVNADDFCSYGERRE